MREKVKKYVDLNQELEKCEFDLDLKFPHNEFFHDELVKEFIEKNDYFTLSFYGDKKDIHKVCGSLSGRDVDKTKMTGLTPVFTDDTVYFNEARLVIICKKQYVAPLTEKGFIDKQILDKWYNGDLHNMIFGKIEKVLIK